MRELRKDGDAEAAGGEACQEGRRGGLESDVRADLAGVELRATDLDWPR